MKNGRHKIIMVDDNPTNLSAGRNILKASHEVYPAQSAAKIVMI